MSRLYSTTRLLCLLFVIGTASADEIFFDDQNFMAGDFKRLERGKIYFKTPGTGTISIELDNVNSVVCTKILEIELQSGKIVYGTLERTGEVGQVEIRSEDDPISSPLLQIVRITPIEEELVERFDGSLNAGMALTRANRYRQFSLGADLEYTTRKYVSTLTADTLRASSEDSDESAQSRLQLRTSRHLRNRWRSGGLLGFESNEEVGIDLRTTIGAAIGRSIRNTNSQTLYIDGGLLYNREDISTSNSTDESVEGFVGFEYQLFRYDEPEVDLTTNLVAIPSVSESGRVRGSLDVILRWELIDDFFWNLSLHSTYDNDPPGDDSSRSDYSIVSGIAWGL